MCFTFSLSAYLSPQSTHSFAVVISLSVHVTFALKDWYKFSSQAGSMSQARVLFNGKINNTTYESIQNGRRG